MPHPGSALPMLQLFQALARCLAALPPTRLLAHPPTRRVSGPSMAASHCPWSLCAWLRGRTATQNTYTTLDGAITSARKSGVGTDRRQSTHKTPPILDHLPPLVPRTQPTTTPQQYHTIGRTLLVSRARRRLPELEHSSKRIRYGKSFEAKDRTKGSPPVRIVV